MNDKQQSWIEKDEEELQLTDAEEKALESFFEHGDFCCSQRQNG